MAITAAVDAFVSYFDSAPADGSAFTAAAAAAAAAAVADATVFAAAVLLLL
jgi:hypothetical protein